MKTKHTKGIWKIHRVFNFPLKNEKDGNEHLTHSIHIGIGDDEMQIAHVLYNSIDAGWLSVKNLDEMEANAKLIAAAPELLGAALKFIELFNNSDMKPEDECHELLNTFNVAIKKATE